MIQKLLIDITQNYLLCMHSIIAVAIKQAETSVKNDVMAVTNRLEAVQIAKN